MQFYTTESISARQHLTPEGFLLCEEVPLARTGEMLYGPGETPVSTGDDGLVHIARDDQEVFRPETVASAVGKPVVDDHPESDVGPHNWRTLARGVVLNPRRGAGTSSDLLLGDILITDADAILSVRSGKREVSCGYDADYEELAPGRGRQRNIVINHVALVDRGRCGPRCSIGDRSATKMAKTRDRRSAFGRALDRLHAAFQAGDEGEFSKAMGAAEAVGGEHKEPDGDEGEHHIEIHNHMPGGGGAEGGGGGAETGAEGGGGDPVKVLEARMDRMEGILSKLATKLGVGGGEEKGGGEEDEKTEDEETGGEIQFKEDNSRGKRLAGSLEMEAPPGTGDRAKKAKDSEYLVDSFQETVALAEIIIPGIRVPTLDRKAAPGKTFDAICGLRRTALELAWAQPALRGVVQDAIGAGRDLDARGMTCDAARSVFRAVGAAKKAINAAGSSRTGDIAGTGGGTGISTSRKVRSPADLNKLMAERYKL